MKKKPYEQEKVISQLGYRIKELRKKAGYTSYETFAYENNFSRTLMSKIEKGQDVRLSTLVRLANAFEISIEEIFSTGFD